MHVVSRGCGLAVALLGASLLSGCGLYFHSDAYQKKTDAAADAVEAALFTPRIQEIGKEAIAVSGEYEGALVQREIALRDRVIVAVVKEPIALAPPSDVDPSSQAPWYGVGFLKSETDRRLGEIVGKENIERYGLTASNLRGDMATEEKILTEAKDAYADEVQEYRAAPSATKKDDVSCKTVLGLPAEELEQFGLGRIADRCKQILESEQRIQARLFGGDASKLGQICEANVAAGELQETYCAVRASESEIRKAEDEKRKLKAAIEALAATFQPSGIEDDPADNDFIAAVEKLQGLLESADLPKQAGAFGYDMLADILKEALAFDVSAAVGEATGEPAASPPDGQGDPSKAAMAGAVIRVVTAGVKFGRAYESQPPFDRANTVIIALASLRHKAGVAEIAAQTERARINYLRGRQEALIREIELLSASWRLQRHLPDGDIVSLSGATALQADAALGTYVASINRGLIPGGVFKERIRNLDIKELDAISVLSGQSTDQVAKAAAEALRAYGKGGLDPAVVFGEILGALAVVGIWM